MQGNSFHRFSSCFAELYFCYLQLTNSYSGLYLLCGTTILLILSVTYVCKLYATKYSIVSIDTCKCRELIWYFFAYNYLCIYSNLSL